MPNVNFVQMVERDLKQEFEVRDAVSFNGVVIRLNSGNDCTETILVTLMRVGYDIVSYRLKYGKRLFIRFN